MDRSNTDFATMSGRADFVCQMDTERSSAPSATTEQMFAVAMGNEVFRTNMCGLYDCEVFRRPIIRCKHSRSLTATSTVFSWPTRLISDVHEPREMTAAINTKPLLLVAFEAVICAPSGDQLLSC